MNAPAGFQRWPLIWFRCPSCGRQTYAPVAELRLPSARRTLFRFWCERCGTLSLPQGSPWLPGVLALLAFGASVVTLLAWLELLSEQSDIAVLVGFLAFLAAWAALNRLANRYARE